MIRSRHDGVRLLRVAVSAQGWAPRYFQLAASEVPSLDALFTLVEEPVVPQDALYIYTSFVRRDGGMAARFC